MSGTDPNLDARLRDYLHAWQHDQESGHTLKNLHLELHQVKLQLEEAVNENKLLRMRVDRHGRRLLAIEQHLAIESDEVGNTGQHQVEDLRRMLAKQEKEIEERKEAGRWWTRSTIQWIVAGAAWILVTTLGLLAMFALPNIIKGGKP